MLNFNQLRAVVALHEHKNFHRAAKSLSITQPALSLSIQNIEELVGQTLFDRSYRSIRATDAGQLVIKYAKDILIEFNNLENALNDFSGVEQGEVEFGVGPYIVKKGFSTVIRKFCRTFPSIRPRFQVAAFDVLHEKLLADQISLYVADSSLGLDSSTCNVESLFEENITFVTRPDHPLTKRQRIQAKDLIQFPFVSVSHRDTSNFEHWFLSKLSTEKDQELFSRNYPFVVCDYYEATRALVLSTNYLAGGPMGLVQKDLSKGTLVELSVVGFDAKLCTGIVTRNDRTLSPATQALKSCFEKVYLNG